MGHFFEETIRANKGPVARDNLSNERTFLSYMRNALNMVSLAIVSTVYISWEVRLSRPVALTFAGASIVAALLGLVRYWRNIEVFPTGKFIAANYIPLLVGLVVTLPTIVTFVLFILFA